MKYRLVSCLLVLVAVVMTLANSLGPLYSGAPQPVDENMQDTGAILTITRELLNGRTLYEQIFTPYGPIPHSAYEVLARVFGNTALTYAGYISLLSAVVLALEFVLLRRYLSLPLALVLYILVLTHFTRISIIYANWEAIGIFLLAILWRPIEERSFARCFLYGVILGVIHFSKFGSDIVVAASLFLLDAIQWIRAPNKAQLLRWGLWSGAIIILGLLFTIAIVAMMLLHALSPPVARDVLWPLYIANSYSRFVGEYRYPYYLGILFFTKIHLPMLAGLAACVVALVALLLDRNFGTANPSSPGGRKDVFPYPLLLPPVFFILACFVLLKHAWHYNQYGIYAAFGTSLAFCVFRPGIRIGTIILLLPYLLVAFVAWVKEPLGIRPAPVLENLNTPSGDVLAGPPDLVHFYQRLFQAVDQEIAVSGTSTDIAVLTDRPGIYNFSGRGVAGRITWYLPSYVRPWEEGTEAAALAHAGAIVLGVPASAATENRLEPEDITQVLGTLFSPKTTAFLAPRLTNPIFVGVDPSAKHVAVWVLALSSHAGPEAR